MMVRYGGQSQNGWKALHLQLENGQANALLAPGLVWSVDGRVDHRPLVLVHILVAGPGRALVDMGRSFGVGWA